VIRDTPRDVLVVCGLQVEARIARGPGVRTIAGGGNSIALAAAIEREIASGVVGIVSFGVAGALLSTLSPGALIVAQSTIFEGQVLSTNAAWSAALIKRLPYALNEPLAGSDRIVADRHDKDRLQRETGAAAVDMESHIAARVAAKHWLPFVALRAIADPLDRVMPPAALIAMRDHGGIDYAAVLASIARSPRQLPQLIAIARDTRRALSALGRGRRLLGARLGYADLDQLPVDVV
jgi:adenosylhomocysteine nucleosidase